MTRYRSYDDVYKRGGADVWPGCGESGRCMSCNGVHNFDYKVDVNGRWVDDYRCAMNHHNGCPRPKPHPVHDYNRVGRCRRCGARRDDD